MKVKIKRNAYVWSNGYTQSNNLREWLRKNEGNWIEVETDGEVEDVVILPRDPDGGPEDRVYYAVKRIHGDLGPVRYLGRCARRERQVSVLRDHGIGGREVFKVY